MNEPDPFQSITVIRRALKAAGVRPSARRGQAFLVDRHAMEKLVASAELDKDDLVLEVGTGTGGLTGYLLEQAGGVVSVEIDRRLAASVQMILGRNERLTLLTDDILRSKHELNPTVTEALLSLWQSGRFERFKLVANLPYSVATPVVAELLRFEPLLPERMCFTVQREVATRISSPPGSRDYGWLSVLVGSLSSVQCVADVSASCFYPSPKVDSTILRLLLDTDRPESARMERFTRLVQYLFQHRRKMLAGNLRKFRKLIGADWSVERVLDETGIDGKLRPENLSVELFWMLSDVIMKHTTNGKSDEKK